MQVLYGEGVACHTGPVPCATDREVNGEALVRGVVVRQAKLARSSR